MLPLFTSSMRDARSAMIFGGAFCCAPAIAHKKQRARLRNTARLGDTTVAIFVSPTLVILSAVAASRKEKQLRSRRIPTCRALPEPLLGILTAPFGRT